LDGGMVGGFFSSLGFTSRTVTPNVDDRTVVVVVAIIGFDDDDSDDE
jgi:hypothetical protein